MGRMGTIASLLDGIIVGWLLGTAVGLVVAPRSGKRTRSILLEQGQDLKERAVQRFEEARQRAKEMAQNGVIRR